MALTAEHFKRIRAAEAELKAAYEAAAAEMADATAVNVTDGATTATWVRVGNRFKQVTLIEPLRIS